MELAIALESMLLDDADGEMTHKLSVRAVRLLGGDISKRKNNLAVFKKMYGLRSKLVHQGEQRPQKNMNVNGVSLSSDELIAKACDLCTKLLRKIIRDGKLPNWQEFDISDSTFNE